MLKTSVLQRALLKEIKGLLQIGRKYFIKIHKGLMSRIIFLNSQNLIKI